MRLPALLFAALPWLAAEPVTPSIDEIIQRMLAADTARVSALHEYSATRKYTLVNHRFKKRAEVVAKLTYAAPGVKKFQVVSESGPGVIRGRVLKKMIEAEEEASQGATRDQARILPANYEFALLGSEAVNDRQCWVVELKPRTQNKFLMRGRIWIDAGENAIVKVEGSPAKNPSFWIKNTKVVQQYAKQGEFWLPLANTATTEARIFGKTDVTIETVDYKINAGPR